MSRLLMLVTLVDTLTWCAGRTSATTALSDSVVTAGTSTARTRTGVDVDASCGATSFPTNLSGTECWGLSGQANDPTGHPIDSADGCLATCCADTTCTLWNYNPTPPIPPRCWLWRNAKMPATCKPTKGWMGGGGRYLPPPPPPPPPGAPHTVVLPAVAPAATPLPYKYDPAAATSPTGGVISADSRSMLMNGKRVYPISGEIHLARVPASQWREQLLRMKGGGLNMVAVYVFWIHHEEVQGQFNFTGRRNVRQFLQIAQDVGLQVLFRAGPWDHGECRNGGHPDWVFGSCGKLRSVDPKYLDCVHGWYAALAEQTKGLYWKDGGPIVAVQVDNETTDWKYLLALQALGISLGIDPAFYTKTGWPAPGPGYPADYPMMPFFGGYADLFWSDSMASQWHSASWMFTGSPSVIPREEGESSGVTSGFTVPPGYPWLDVEIGGGMAASYNHRVHMDAADMPSMHLCDVGDGVNQLGYYMYHGGNNPHSLIHTDDRDAPETTMQESSFQPAGPANPMPSISYDFFAPLGEFGQPRQHYHMMRRLHVFLESWGEVMASTVPVPPPAIPADNTTLRWSVRTAGLEVSAESSSFLFVNNYQRIDQLARKELVRFKLTSNESTRDVPSIKSKPLTIAAGIWFVWPVNIPLGGGVTLLWSTAQLVSSIDTESSGVVTTTIFMAEIEGVPSEVGIDLGGHASIIGTASASNATEGDAIVFRNIAMGYSSFVSIFKVDNNLVNLVLFPAALTDLVFTGKLAGQQCLFVAPDPMLLVTDGDTLHLRTGSVPSDLIQLAVFPRSIGLSTPTGAVPHAPNHLFEVYNISAFNEFTDVSVDVTLTQPAGPPRVIPRRGGSGKPREPNATEWAAAAVYTLTVHLNGTQTIRDGDEVRLAIDYAGDAARVYYGNRLLTDNWFSGYDGDGALEVGLTYLAGENPGLTSDGAELTLLILPLKLDSLQTDIFIQPALWPDFRGEPSVCSVSSLTAKHLGSTDLTASSLIGMT